MIAVLRGAGLVLAAVLASPAVAQGLPDVPELAQPGAYPVGVLRMDLTDPAQKRDLPLTIWYPSAGQGGAPAHYVMKTPGPAATGGHVGVARVDVPALTGKRFPLVVFSHGYRNWATGFSDLAEGLASHGYVVAAIDHTDIEPAKPEEGLRSFARVVQTRSADQRFVIAELTRRATRGPLANSYDPTAIALIGYSMGGFGALITAGAGLDPKNPFFKIAPGMDAYAEGSSLEAQAPAGVKAIVAFAPWGATPPLRAWTPKAVANITVPILFAVGDQDDVSGYGEGVEWLYQNAVGADRTMLVYQNARHNIVGDGVAGIPDPSFEWVERLEEPVWRRDRILAINRHFVTAFLDRTLKNDSAHGALLTVPTEKAADGAWPLGAGQSVGARYAAPDDSGSRGYWPGFQRRWALGLELHHAAPGARP
ncbi:alpha/beta hydrolase family protein [Sphingomonas elodea]|uniref:alpha/beta hydrolase family protein n=1 Tax=Sphingomonas elodea TaxID=179878 RepID=UPI000263086A|nr:dienelactone hydrolase [Sphingomonas elodea]